MVEPDKVRATWADYVSKLGADDLLESTGAGASSTADDNDGDALVDLVASPLPLRDCTDRISSSPSTPGPFDDDYTRRLVKALTKLDSTARTVPELDARITWKEVWRVIAGLPRGKAAGEDGITAELLKLAGIGTAMALSTLFNKVLELGK